MQASSEDEREQAWRSGYEFGRAEAAWEYVHNRIAGAPIVSTCGDEVEAFWAYHLRRVEEGHYESADRV
jgi:hypothetical protein